MTWYRVFGRSDAIPTSADIERCLADVGLSVRLSFVENATGWNVGRLEIGETIIELTRWHADEEGIRAELNSWAAYVESCEESPRSAALMEQLIQSRQLIYFEEPTPDVREVCTQLSQCLARLADGCYHVEGEGFFTAEGALLLAAPG